LWNFVWSVLDIALGQSRTRVKDRLFGNDEPSFVNDLVFLASNSLYKRFLYNVNSGKSEFDLIGTFKFRLHEMIYLQYVSAKGNDTISFFFFWYLGVMARVFSQLMNTHLNYHGCSPLFSIIPFNPFSISYYYHQPSPRLGIFLLINTSPTQAETK